VKARTGSGSGSGVAQQTPPTAPPAKDIDSKDILARTETSPDVYVKHVLLSWKDMMPGRSSGHGATPGADRTNDDAAKLAQEIEAKLKANPDQIDALMAESSEDKASVGGEPYEVKPDSPLVPEFKNLSLRLKEKEVGIVKSRFGYHVIERVGKPPADPIESADILAREPPGPEPVRIQHIQIGWKDLPAAKAGADKPAAGRTKEEADKLVTEVLAKARKGDDMAKLMKEYSEDTSSKDTGRAIDLAGPVPRGFESLKALALRLKVNEVGVAKTPAGFFVIKHIPPAPPDPIESADILKREPQAAKVKVKHILLGWTEVHADDERGKKRTRAELEKLVKATVAKLRKGDKIEPLMTELSEDPGSAKTGMSYDVSPDAGLVESFKKLSLRLKLNEVGVVRTNFGVHIIQRVE
jgi:parvulin-like peptidyl-prolyl isomerase